LLNCLIPHRLRFLLLVIGLGLPAAVLAHLVNLLPDAPAARLHDKVAGVIFLGHPFEHELLDLEQPEWVKVHLPGGSVLDLSARLQREKVKGAGGQETPSFRFSFEAGERGDFVISAASRPRFEAEEEGFIKDYAKVVLHVQAQRGWERAVGTPLEVVPLTRPYGLRRGEVFLAKALFEGKPLEGEAAEVEHANPKPPAKLPEDEFITRAVRTGPGGLIAATLDEPGWWAITVSRKSGTLPREGTDLPVTLRSTFWVWVGEPLLERD
jgi:cobalt/nickel transport protein